MPSSKRILVETNLQNIWHLEQNPQESLTQNEITSFEGDQYSSTKTPTPPSTTLERMVEFHLLNSSRLPCYLNLVESCFLEYIVDHCSRYADLLLTKGTSNISAGFLSATVVTAYYLQRILRILLRWPA